MHQLPAIDVLASASVIALVTLSQTPVWAQDRPPAVAEGNLTDNEKAANGPLPGDLSLYMPELKSCQEDPIPGYYPGLATAEMADAQRSGLFPHATFTGSFDGPNTVFAWRSQDDYESCTFIVNREPGEIYIVGGDNPPFQGPVPAGPYVAKADATTGKEIWRTYVENANVSKAWIGAANLNVLPNGQIPFCWSTKIVLLDGDTGRVLKQTDLPTGETPAADTNFKHLTVAPDGTLICKSQTRPTGSEMQGTLGIVKGLEAGFKQSNSYLVAVDPETLEVIAELQLPEPATVPHIIAAHDGKTAIYVGMDSGCRRVYWDRARKKLTLDDGWHLQPVQEGQSTACAPSIIGDWVILQMNGTGSRVKASSVAAGHADDSNKTQVIFPFGELKPGGWSWVPPKACVDPENSMIYSADVGVRKVAGIKIDPTTGELTLAFTLDNMSTTFQPTYGSRDQRVLVLTNMKQIDPSQPVDVATFSGNYTEQVTWHDAATGRKLAESDFFEPLTVNSLLTPGYGGRYYFPTAKGFITLQIVPAGD